MSKLDVLRLFVDRRLSALTDDIFRCFAKTVTEYEREVFRLKQETDRQRRLLKASGLPETRAGGPEAPETGPGEPEGSLQVRGRSFSAHIKQEEGGALGPQGTDMDITQGCDWLRERLETDQSPSSNQVQSCREAGPVNQQEVFRVKQEGDEGHMFSSQQEGVVQILTTEEEPQVRGRDLSLKSPDWLMQSDNDEGSSSPNRIQFHRDDDLLPAPPDHLIRPEPGGTCKPTRHSVIQSESSTEDSDETPSEPGPRRTRATETELLVCGSCGREFSSKRTLRKHIRRNTSQDQVQMSCSLRRQRVPFRSPAKSFSCRVCGSSFYTQGILVRHAENHCKEPESLCGACGEHLESTETLRDHLRAHKELGSTCDVCGKKCSSIRRMEIHKRVHTGEKPYQCGFCGRDFSRKESLERHLKVHSGDGPHRCGLCRRTFTRREYLVTHLDSGHTERPGPAGTAAFIMTP